MKVVKIVKSFNCRSKEHYIILLDNKLYLDDDINDIVIDWCDSELSGKYYGYSYEWEIVEDINLINEIIKNKIIIINNQIEQFEIEKRQLESYLKISLEIL